MAGLAKAARAKEAADKRLEIDLESAIADFDAISVGGPIGVQLKEKTFQEEEEGLIRHMIARGDYDTAGAIHDEYEDGYYGYSLPGPSEILPSALVNLNSLDLVRSSPALSEVYIEWNDQYLTSFAMWWSTSRYAEVMGQERVNETPFEALPPGKFAPQLTVASETGVIMPWLGCRCSWPVTEQCYYALCWQCGLSKWVGMAWVIFTTLTEVLLLDSLVVQSYISFVPTARTWDYIAKQRMPLQPRVAEVVFLFVVTWLLMGQVIKPTDAENLNGYYQSKTVARVLLRSLASHREGRTYAYCTVVTWAVVTVLQGTVLPAYIVLLISTTYFTTISGETLQDMAKFYLIFAFVVNINTQALSMLQFFTCLDRSQTEYSSKYIRGHRVKKEVRAMTFVYGWFTGIVCAVSLIAFHFTFSLLWLWQIPISMLVFEVMQSSFAPCLFGWPACPVGTASCLYATWSLTTLACILLFVYKHACFLFPCLCAPEIPGWMFFPPRNDLWSPLRGAYDYDLSFYDAPLWNLLQYFSGYGPEECRWEPTEDALKVQGFMWRFFRQQGVGPDECLRYIDGGCSDPWEPSDDSDIAYIKWGWGGSSGYKEGWDNQRPG